MTIALPDVEPATDPHFRRHLDDVRREFTHLTDAVDRAPRCDFETRDGSTCGAVARWIMRSPCGCPVLLCHTHQTISAATVAKLTPSWLVMCGVCRRVFSWPFPITFERL